MTTTTYEKKARAEIEAYNRLKESRKNMKQAIKKTNDQLANEIWLTHHTMGQLRRHLKKRIKSCIESGSRTREIIMPYPKGAKFRTKLQYQRRLYRWLKLPKGCIRQGNKILNSYMTITVKFVSI